MYHQKYLKTRTKSAFIKVKMDTPGTVDQCLSLRCETAALRWPGPRFLQPAADSDEAETKCLVRQLTGQKLGTQTQTTKQQTFQKHDTSAVSMVYLCVCRLGSLQHVRHSTGQVLSSTQ